MTSVHGIAGLVSMLAHVRARLGDWTWLWRRLSARLPQAQMDWWDRRFGLGLRHSRVTIEERQAGLGVPVREARRRRRHFTGTYYQRNRPGARASADDPYFEWTGSLRRATDHWTEQEALRAAIDTERNYQGPLRIEMPGVRDPVDAVMPGVPVWSEAALEALLEDEMEAGVEAALTQGGAP